MVYMYSALMHSEISLFADLKHDYLYTNVIYKANLSVEYMTQLIYISKPLIGRHLFRYM